MSTGKNFYLSLREPAVHWIVRRSLDGTNWDTSDDFFYVSDNYSEANSVRVNPITGDVYVVGLGRKSDPSPFGEKLRDEEGGMRRQAARFRIYGYNASGKVVREITGDETEINWQVHLANKKAHWYRFLAALDLAEAKKMAAPKRNPEIVGEDRRSLIIDPGARSISGIEKSGSDYEFDTGHFRGAPVYLGELRTDERGRLLVLGGHGKSGSPLNKPVYYPENIDTFNNADGWYDDISDGPVRATITIGGETKEVESAWVIVAPPNYAPDVVGWRTLYDLVIDTYVRKGWLPVPAVTSFSRDVLPALQRLTRLQWVNQGFAEAFGKGSAFDFEDPSLISQLATSENLELRKRIYDLFRVAPAPPLKDTRRLWPMIYGDAFGSFPESPDNHLMVSDLLSLHLKRWVSGDFISDWEPKQEPFREFEKVPLEQQPAMLDKSALHFCLADAFHPGCELTWPMRHATLFKAPFRINRHEVPSARSSGVHVDDYGDDLSGERVLQKDGPLYGQGPGDLTRWMAVPWQGDTVFCRSGYEPEFDPYLPTFWPARVPNHVLTLEDYRTLMEACGTRTNAFSGEGWISVGDAAFSFDPLSSQGIFNALYAGMKAAQAINDEMRGRPQALLHYTNELEKIRSIYLRRHQNYYSTEKRWKDKVFWRRRV